MNATRQIIRAADEGDADRIRALVADDPELARAKGYHNITPLHAAAEKNHVDAVRALLDAGAELEAETTWGMTPLQWAANMGSAQAGALLLERGARLNIWAAAGLGLINAVKSFIADAGTLKPGAAQNRCAQNLDGEWQTLPPPSEFEDAVSDAFYVASRNGQTEVARYLLELGADVNFRGFFGGTGLHWAAINGHRETVEFLLSRGADMTLKDEQFQSTPREWALEQQRDDIAQLLVPDAAAKS
jgi:ankyrin repeat protein